MHHTLNGLFVKFLGCEEAQEGEHATSEEETNGLSKTKAGINTHLFAFDISTTSDTDKGSLRRT